MATRHIPNDNTIGRGLTAADPATREQAIEALADAIISNRTEGKMAAQPTTTETLSTFYSIIKVGLKHDDRHIRRAASRACQQVRAEVPEAIAPLHSTIRSCVTGPIPIIRQAARGCLASEDAILHVYASD